MRTSSLWALSLLMFSATFLPSVVVAASTPDNDAQLVRLSYVEGDVRFNRGDDKGPNLKKPWEQAEVNLPIEQNFALATDDGRAVLEFEDGSEIYVAENSVVIFDYLNSTLGLLRAQLELVSGAVTTDLKPVYAEVFEIDMPTGRYQVTYPRSSFVRIDSFLDGFAVTPQSDAGSDFSQNGSSDLRIAKGETLTFQSGQPVRIDGAGQSKAPNDWDQWVNAQVEARNTAMQAALKASGLSAPIPGLTDLYANGTFSSCAPYGMCWEPSQQAATPPQAVPPGPTAQPPGGKPFKPQLVAFRTLIAECPAPEWMTTASVLAKTPQELNQLSLEAYRWELRQTWIWPVCHYSSWIYRNAGYHLVIRKKKRRHPIRWVKAGKTTGFVPPHPADQKGKPPKNLKHGILTVSSQGGAERVEKVDFIPSEKVETLSDPPKEFRVESSPRLASAEAPKIQGRLLGALAQGAKPGEAKQTEAPIAYDYNKGAFVQSGATLVGRKTKPVIVGGLSARGNFGASSNGRSSGSAGRSGGSSGRASSSYRGGGSSAGRSNSGGGGGGGGSRGGGGGGGSRGGGKK